MTTPTPRDLVAVARTNAGPLASNDWMDFADQLAAALDAQDAAAPELPECTGVTASWCPVHGDCVCARSESGAWVDGQCDPGCPLHAPASDHAEPAAPDLPDVECEHFVETLHCWSDITWDWCPNCGAVRKPAGSTWRYPHDRAEVLQLRAERDELRARVASWESRYKMAVGGST